MELTIDFFQQLEDLYLVKSWHLKYLNSVLPDAWQAAIPGGYGDIWEKRGWKFFLKDYRPFPKTLGLLRPDKRRLLVWTMIGFANELIMDVSPESLGDFLGRYIDNPTARRNLWELFLGEEMDGVGFKAFGSLVVCAREENRFLDRYLPTLRTFAESDPRTTGIDDELRDSAISFFREIDDFRRYLDSDVFLFRRLNRDLKELFRSGVSVGVLGYGERSSVLALTGEGRQRPAPGSSLAYKKMPPFPDGESVESYRGLFERYHLLLREVGLNPPRHGVRQISREDGSFTVFATQTRLPSESIGSNVAKAVGEEDIGKLFSLVLEEILKVAEYNRRHPELLIGIDARISDWAVGGYDAGNPHVSGDERLFYIDTSTPMMRENGVELLDTELMFGSFPYFARPLVRAFSLKDVLNRYYETRAMVVNLIASFKREGRPEVLPDLVDDANRFFDERMRGFGLEPITVKEVERRYRRARRARTWLHIARRIDRFMNRKILGRKYPYRMPEG